MKRLLATARMLISGRMNPETMKCSFSNAYPCVLRARTLLYGHDAVLRRAGVEPLVMWRMLSSSPTIKITTNEADFWRNKTHRLLETDSLAPQDWNEIEKTLQWWTRQGTKESVDRAWEILDRLAEEVNGRKHTNDVASQLRTKLLTDWLNFTVDAWRRLIEDASCNPQKATSGTALMRADEVLEKVESFPTYMLPDVQTYSMIVDAKTLQAPAEAAQFAEMVLERMHQMSYANPLVVPNVITYGSVINAWAKSGLPNAGEKAEYCVTTDGRRWFESKYGLFQLCHLSMGKQ